MRNHEAIQWEVGIGKWLLDECEIQYVSFSGLSISCCHFLHQVPKTGEFLGEFKLTASCWLEALGQGISEMRSMSECFCPQQPSKEENIKPTSTSQPSLLGENMRVRSLERGSERVSYCALKTFSNANGRQTFSPLDSMNKSLDIHTQRAATRNSRYSEVSGFHIDFFKRLCSRAGLGL